MATFAEKAAADRWWDSLPDDRRAQLYRWITMGGGYAGPRQPMDGEQRLFPEALFSDPAGCTGPQTTP